MNDDQTLIQGDQLIEDYRRYTARKVTFIVILLIVAIVSAGYTMTVGIRDMGLFESFSILFDHIRGATYEIGSEAWLDDYTIWNLRLPRVLAAVFVGMGLTISGVAMQSITANPLAEPYTVGMSSGASFGVAVALVLGFSFGTMAGSYGMVLNAFVFGSIPAVLAIAITGFRKQSPATIILVGTAVSYIFNAMSTLVLMRADPATLQRIMLWQIGTVAEVGWYELPLIMATVVVGSILMMILSKKMNMLSVGGESAKTMGVDVNTLRIIILAILTVVTAVIVSFTGIIGFLGLVAPHIMRLVIGGDNRFIIPAAGLFGATFLLVADAIARYAGDMPVGVVMSFIGAPMFLYLVMRMRRDVW